jgi:hypothetical protein
MRNTSDCLVFYSCMSYFGGLFSFIVQPYLGEELQALNGCFNIITPYSSVDWSKFA